MIEVHSSRGFPASLADLSAAALWPLIAVLFSSTYSKQNLKNAEVICIHSLLSADSPRRSVTVNSILAPQACKSIEGAEVIQEIAALKFL